MAKDNWSIQRNKVVDGGSSGERVDSGKGTSSSGAITVDSSGLRRPTRDTSSSRQMTLTPSSTRKSERVEARQALSSGHMTLSLSSPRKSERLEKQTPTTPTLLTRKSERLEKQNTPSPLRRSDRSVVCSPSASSGSKSLEKVSSSVDRLNKTEKEEIIVKQLTMEPENVILGENGNRELSSLKRKKMDGRSYKALFMRSRKHSASGSDDKLERQDMLPPIDGIGGNTSGSKPLKDENGDHECGQMVTEDLREEPLDGALSGAPSGLKISDAKITRDDMKPEFSYSGQCFSNKPAGPSDRDDLRVSIIGCNVIGTIDDAKRGPKVQSTMWHPKIPKVVTSTCMSKSLGSNTEVESGAQYMQLEGKRKRVYHAENDEAAKKHQKVFISCNGSTTFQPDERDKSAGFQAATNQSESLPSSVACALGNTIKANIVSQESDMPHSGERTPNQYKSLHSFLRAEMAKLCDTLKFSKDINCMVQNFLEYVMENHHVSKEPASILQAFQISLCWIAASILKEKIDWRDSLKLAKQTLNFMCTEEEATSVYVKLRPLKRKFLQLIRNKSDSIPSENVASATEDMTAQPPKAVEPPPASFNLLTLKVEVEESSLEPSQEQATDELTPNNTVGKKFIKFQNKCDKNMLKLHQNQKEEIQGFHKMRQQKRVQLEGEHQLESAFIRTMYNQTAMGMDKLKIAESEFEKKMQEYECIMEMQLKELEAMHAAAIEKVRKRVADSLAKMESCMSQYKNVDELQMDGSEYCEMGSSEGDGHITSKSPENEVTCCGPYLEEKSPDRIVHVSRASNVIVSDILVIAADDAAGYSTQSKTLSIPVNPDSDKAVDIVPAEASSVARVEQSKESSRTSYIVREVYAQDAIGCSVPAETSPFLLNSTSEKALEIVPAETSSVAGSEQPKKVHYLSHTAQDITPDCSSHGVEEIVSGNLATCEEDNTHEVSSNGQTNVIPSQISCTTGSEIGNACTSELGAIVVLNTVGGTGSSMGSDVIGNQKCGTDSSICGTAPSQQIQSKDQVSMHAFPSSELQLQSVLHDEYLPNIESAGKDLPVSGDQTAAAGSVSSTPVHAEFTEQSNCEARVTADSEQMQLSSDCLSPDHSQLAAEAGQQGYIDRSNSLQNPEALPQFVKRPVELHQAVSQAGENMVQLASHCSSSVCSQTTIAEAVHQNHVDESNSVPTSEALPGENLVQPVSNFSSPVCSQSSNDSQDHIKGSNSIQGSEASLLSVDGSVELSHEVVSQNGENLVRPTSDCSSPMCSQPSVTESVHPGDMEKINSPGISEPSSQVDEGSLELSQQSVPRNGENLLLPPFTEGRDLGLNLETVYRTNHERNAEVSAVSQNPATPSQVVGNAAELLNQPLQQSRTNVAIAEGSTNLMIHRPHHVASWNPTTEPLQNELERIRKEVEQTTEHHDSMKLQFKSECEKEIEEMIAQVRSKYEAKLRDAETAFLLKKTELDSNLEKVLMNKILAEAFQSKCLDLRHSGISSMQQGTAGSNQISLRPTVRHPCAATLSSEGLPAVTHQTSIPSVPSIHRSSGLFPSVTARPPQISSITPSLGGRRVGGEIRAPAPHLQSFRPPAFMSPAASSSCLPCNIPSQQLPKNLPARSLSLSSVPIQPSLPSQFSLQQNPLPSSQPRATLQPRGISQTVSSSRPSQPESGVLPGCPSPALSMPTVKLLMNFDDQAGSRLPNKLHHSEGSSLNTTMLDPSFTRALGNMDHNRTPPAIASGVFCLSDDDD